MFSGWKGLTREGRYIIKERYRNESTHGHASSWRPPCTPRHTRRAHRTVATAATARHTGPRALGLGLAPALAGPRTGA